MLTLAIAASLMAAPAAPQVRTDMRRIDPKVINAPVRRLEPKPATRVVTLIELPADMVHLGATPGWTITRQPKAPPGGIGPGAGAAAYVGRFGNSTAAKDCTRNGGAGSIRDYFDLSRIVHGPFDLEDVRVTPVEPPISLSDQPSYAITYTSTNLRNYNVVKGNATGVYVDATIGRSAQLPGMPRHCWAGYRLHITVRGPANVNPLTGQTFTPARVN